MILGMAPITTYIDAGLPFRIVAMAILLMLILAFVLLKN